mmetsp:Transcript_22934/g.47849  ORF Transcript_22934/g.47849 Transcript_22934/m.47849 type:complete len:218 (-) Transcript_22934:210-863(-)
MRENLPTQTGNIFNQFERLLVCTAGTKNIFRGTGKLSKVVFLLVLFVMLLLKVWFHLRGRSSEGKFYFLVRVLLSMVSKWRTPREFLGPQVFGHGHNLRKRCLSPIFLPWLVCFDYFFGNRFEFGCGGGSKPHGTRWGLCRALVINVNWTFSNLVGRCCSLEFIGCAILPAGTPSRRVGCGTCFSSNLRRRPNPNDTDLHFIRLSIFVKRPVSRQRG